MSRTRSVVTVGALVLTAACASAPPKVDVRSEEDAIRALEMAAIAAIQQKNAAAVAAFFTPDATFQLANQPAAVGTAAIRQEFEGLMAFQNLQFSATPTSIEVASSGDLGHVHGTYRMSFSTPDGPVQDEGIYSQVWKKTAANGWKIAREVAVSTKPAAPPPAPLIVMVESDQPGMHAAAGLTWSDLTRPGLKPGAKISVVHGDPAGTGDYTIRLRFPDGFEVPPHWHPNAEHVTVLQGTFMFGMGSTFDRAKLQTHGPGDFLYAPAKSPHFVTVRGETIVQLHGQGPFQLNLVGANP